MYFSYSKLLFSCKNMVPSHLTWCMETVHKMVPGLWCQCLKIYCTLTNEIILQSTSTEQRLFLLHPTPFILGLLVLFLESLQASYHWGESLLLRLRGFRLLSLTAGVFQPSLQVMQGTHFLHIAEGTVFLWHVPHLCLLHWYHLGGEGYHPNLAQDCSTFCPLEDFLSPPAQGCAREGLCCAAVYF